MTIEQKELEKILLEVIKNEVDKKSIGVNVGIIPVISEKLIELWKVTGQFKENAQKEKNAIGDIDAPIIEKYKELRLQCQTFEELEKKVNKFCRRYNWNHGRECTDYIRGIMSLQLENEKSDLMLK